MHLKFISNFMSTASRFCVWRCPLANTGISVVAKRKFFGTSNHTSERANDNWWWLIMFVTWRIRIEIVALFKQSELVRVNRYQHFVKICPNPHQIIVSHNYFFCCLDRSFAFCSVMQKS